MEKKRRIKMRKNKNQFVNETTSFMETILPSSLKDERDQIMIKYFTPSDQLKGVLICNSPEEAAEGVYVLNKNEMNNNMKVGINPRVIDNGNSTIKHVNILHAIIYNKYKETSLEIQYDEWVNSIPWYPSLILDTGSYLHYFWKLKEPVLVDKIWQNRIEILNSYLTDYLEGYTGKYGFDSIYQFASIPGTYYYRNFSKFKKVKLIIDNANDYYDIEELWEKYESEKEIITQKLQSLIQGSNRLKKIFKLKSNGMDSLESYELNNLYNFLKALKNDSNSSSFNRPILP
jgi:hypothetical protein